VWVFAEDFTAKNNKTILVNTSKPNFVVFFVLIGAAASWTAKISSCVKVENNENILPTTLASWEVDNTDYSKFE